MSGKGFTLAITLVLSLLPAGCQETVTEPEVEELPAYGALEISYEADQASAESGEITAELGGTVSATGPDGVVYTLVAGPGAVAGPTTITITPLLELSVCSIDGSHIDTSACVVGALFEPAGLEFDSTVVLTVSYPGPGFPCAISDYLCIVTIDSASSYYEIMPTSTDEGVPSLACTLAHFSGYGVHGPDHDFLKMLIKRHSEYGRDFPGDDILIKLMSLASRAAAMEWYDLRDLAWQGAYPILDYLAGIAIDNAAADPGEEALDALARYLALARVMGFTDIESRIMQSADTLVMTVATRGDELCGSGDQTEGRALLVQAYGWACSGLVIEDSTKDMIFGWLIDCSGIEVHLEAERSYVNTAAATSDGIDEALLTFTVTVQDDYGSALAWCEVTLKWDGSGLWSGSTDGDGIFTVTISGSRIGVGPSYCPPHTYNRTFYAEVNSGGTLYRSNNVPIEIRDIRITGNVSYDYEYSYIENENSVIASSHISGEGTGCTAVCEGTLTRSYSIVINDVWSTTAVGRLEINACHFQPQYQLVQTPSGLLVALVTYINQDLDYLTDDILLEECDETEHCETREGDLCTELPEYAWVCDCDPYSDCVIKIYDDGTGTFQYLWENSASGPNWSYTAQLSVLLTISF